VTHDRLAESVSALRGRSTRPRFLMVAVLLCGALVCLPVLVGDGAVAAKKLTVEQAAAKVQALRDQAERSSERYNALREQLTSLGVRRAAAQRRMVAQRTRTQAAQAALGQVLAESYKQGDLSRLALFLSDDPDALLAQSGVVATLGERRVTAVQQLRDEQARLTADAADLARQRQRIADATASLQSLRGTIAGQLAAARKQLAQLEASERAAVERLLAGGDTQITCAQAGVSFSGRSGKILQYACAQLGDPYVWGAAGPSTFDCSGLTLRAMQAISVSVPHFAESQAGYGTRIPPTQAALQPGDLVFFHRPITHVGIYLGRGLMIHAPHTGTVVKIARVPWASAVAAARY
jgi:cell wall-associated NlpC family hydrolase